MIKKQYTFVRYGKLKPVKQKGVGATNYHSPPCSRGFYAFPFGYEELFLVAGLSHQRDVGLPQIIKHETSRYFNRITGEEVIEHDTYETKNIWLHKRRFIAGPKVLIWHHLREYVIHPKDIIDTRKSWVCTTVEVWRKTFNRVLRKQQVESWKKYTDTKGSVKEVKLGGFYFKDHLEVFFEKI